MDLSPEAKRMTGSIKIELLRKYFDMDLCVEANGLPINVQTRICKIEFQSDGKGVFGVEVFKDGERIGEIGFGFKIWNGKFCVSPTARVYANDPYYDHIVDTFDKIIESRVWKEIKV